MYCENCGAKLNDNEKFCQNCGAKVKMTEQTPDIPQQPTYQPPRQPTYAQQVQPQYAWQMQNEPLETPRARKTREYRQSSSKAGPAAAIISAVLAIVTVIVFLFQSGIFIKKTEKRIPELETASEFGAVAVKGYVYARLLTEEFMQADLKSTPPDELTALLDEAISAWEAVRSACDGMAEYAGRAEVVKSGNALNAYEANMPAICGDNPIFPFAATAYAYTGEDDERARDPEQWAKKINELYDNMTDKNLVARERMKQLAKLLDTDARDAIEKFTDASMIIKEINDKKNTAWSWATRGAEIAFVGSKIGLFISGFFVSGGTIGASGVTLPAFGSFAEKAAFVLSGADCLVSIGDEGARIILGDEHVVTKTFEKAGDVIALPNTLFAVCNIKNLLPIDKFTLISGNLADWFANGKVAGLEITKPLQSYLMDFVSIACDFLIDDDYETEEEAIAAVQNAGGPELPAPDSVNIADWLGKIEITAEELYTAISFIEAAAGAAETEFPEETEPPAETDVTPYIDYIPSAKDVWVLTDVKKFKPGTTPGCRIGGGIETDGQWEQTSNNWRYNFTMTAAASGCSDYMLMEYIGNDERWMGHFCEISGTVEGIPDIIEPGDTINLKMSASSNDPYGVWGNGNIVKAAYFNSKDIIPYLPPNPGSNPFQEDRIVIILNEFSNSAGKAWLRDGEDTFSAVINYKPSPVLWIPVLWIQIRFAGGGSVYYIYEWQGTPYGESDETIQPSETVNPTHYAASALSMENICGIYSGLLIIESPDAAEEFREYEIMVEEYYDADKAESRLKISILIYEDDQINMIYDYDEATGIASALCAVDNYETELIMEAIGIFSRSGDDLLLELTIKPEKPEDAEEGIIKFSGILLPKQEP